MLSRTANGLFWMSRYIERMENIARLLDAGRRMDALPQPAGTKSSEWASIVIASGCRDSYPGVLDEADLHSVTHHLIFDPENPSSIRQCMATARENARAMRAALTTEVWDAINLSWGHMRSLQHEDALGPQFPVFIDWVKSRGALVRGAMDATLLRDEGFAFIQLGKRIERADATARLLDVKYHVLLPRSEDVGGGLDYLQWIQVLRAANASSAYRHLYRNAVDARGVVDLLVCNRKSPRSLSNCVGRAVDQLEAIGAHNAQQEATLGQARTLQRHVIAATIDEILAFGLHEWLTEFIGAINALALDVAEAYGFDGASVPSVASQSQ